MNAGSLTKFTLAAATVVALHAGTARAEFGVHVDIGLPLPPPIVFSVAPQLIVLPGTYVYAVPDYGEELYFVDGFWWRPWQGRWYRSAYYDRDWVLYGAVPTFYGSIRHDWRTWYSRGEWDGRPWNYQRVSYNDVHRNWSTWKKEKRWDRDRVEQGRTTDRDRDTPSARTIDRDRSAPSSRSVDKNRGAPARTIDRDRAPEVKRSQPSRPSSSKSDDRQYRGNQQKQERPQQARPAARSDKGQSPSSKGASSKGPSSKGGGSQRSDGQKGNSKK